MKNQNIFILLFVSFFSVKYASGQNVIDVKGEPLRITKYAELEGSPFIFTSWTKGQVKFVNGYKLGNIDLKYDEIKDALVFKGKEGEEFYFTDRIEEFNLSDKIFKNGFLPYKNFSSQSFFEIIISGKLTLLKKNSKIISETKEYNSATTIKKTIDKFNLYIARENEIMATQKDNIKTIAYAIDSKKSPDLIEFINRNQLNLKRQDDLIKLVNYYNTL